MFVVNNPAFFLSHRLPIAQAAQREGYEVHVATPFAPSVADITAQGFMHHPVSMSRSGKNPLQELTTLYTLWRLFRSVRPDIVHAVTIKPVLYGGIAARLARVPGYVAAVSGLGFVFMRDDPVGRLVRQVAIRLYRLALGHPNSRVIFQNANDCDTLREAGAVREEQVVMIRGSGVDLDVYRPEPEPEGAPVVAMASRLLVDKGVREYVQAARLTKGHPSGVRWLLAGSADAGNPASVDAGELKRWQGEGVIELLGEQKDIPALYARAHIVALPSYREGLPKGLVEAAACGRAVVTTDVPGCRDAIEADVTGLLVPVKDARALADAVIRLVEDGDLRRRMGEAGRQLAETAFDIRQVVRRHLDVYAALG
ncbi:glycosyltransferase family 4 protein [Paracandidimonas soli]